MSTNAICVKFASKKVNKADTQCLREDLKPTILPLSTMTFNSRHMNSMVRCFIDWYGFIWRPTKVPVKCLLECWAMCVVTLKKWWVVFTATSSQEVIFLDENFFELISFEQNCFTAFWCLLIHMEKWNYISNSVDDISIRPGLFFVHKHYINYVCISRKSTKKNIFFCCADENENKITTNPIDKANILFKKEVCILCNIQIYHHIKNHEKVNQNILFLVEVLLFHHCTFTFFPSFSLRNITTFLRKIYMNILLSWQLQISLAFSREKKTPNDRLERGTHTLCMIQV